MIEASAPATLMLMGEHAVLHGKQAVVACTTQRLFVRLSPREDQQLSIHSNLGRYETALHDLTIERPFQFVLALVRMLYARYGKAHPQGFHLEIKSDFGATLGLGSSAAVLIATAAALIAFYKASDSIFKTAYAALLEAQGRGSGADLAAALTGGIIAYHTEPLMIRKLWPNPHAREIPTGLVYCGYKTPTAEVIAKVDAATQHEPQRFAKIFNEIDSVSQKGAHALERGDLATFATTLWENQALMVELGVSDPTLTNIVHTLEQDPGIRAAKISGSGLGDCVFTLGIPENPPAQWQWIPIQLSDQGLRLSLEDA